MPYAPACRFAIGLCTLSLLALAAGCPGGSSSTGSGGNNGSGGSGSGGSGSGGVVILTGSGGSSASGGNSGSTGSGGNGSGGNVGSGGSVSSSGGATGGGGNQSTGGSSGSGGTTGSGGNNASGGATGSGGNASGGATGSGGNSASGGATGSGGNSASGGASGSGGAGGAPFFTDDFESDASGKQPAGFDNLISYNFNTTNPQGDGTGAVADGTHVHGGKMAVHFKGSGNPAFLELALPSGTNHLYSRVWVYSSVQLGNGPSSDNHETLLGITGDPKSVNTQVRFGMIKGAVGTNQVPSDNIAPVMAKWYMPPSISANTWHCIEVEFDGSASYNSLYAYSDGTLVHSIAAAADWQNGALPATWMSGMFTDFMFGWQSFSSAAADVWMDDLALSTKGRIGCN
jgi:hypothetical protein